MAVIAAVGINTATPLENNEKFRMRAGVESGLCQNVSPTPARKAQAAAATASFAAREKPASRAMAASISRDSRPNPRLPASPHLAAADHGKPDADALFSHGCLRSPR